VSSGPGRDDVQLRDVTEADLAVFFEHQRDPEASRMAAFPPRELDAFTAHWTTNILGDATVIKKAVLVDGWVVGSVVSFDHGGERLVGYWIGREHWGKGVATRALSEFLRHETTRPLVAHVAKDNVASIRVLEKCGFERSGEHVGEDGVEELIMELR
jgi:RimJ/RimL family protein N-acetyltransferase